MKIIKKVNYKKQRISNNEYKCMIDNLSYIYFRHCKIIYVASVKLYIMEAINFIQCSVLSGGIYPGPCSDPS